MKTRLIAFIRNNPSYVIGVLLPSLILAIYLAFFASDRYVSEARLIVERDSSRGSGLDLGLLSLAPGNSALDVELVKRFIESPAMVDYLDQTLHLREHFTDGSVDPFSRLSAHASHESFVEYFLGHVDAQIDKDSLSLDLAVQGFDPVYAQKMGQAVVEHAEQFVNEVGQSLAREQVRFAQNEVEKSNRRLVDAANDLIAYQDKHEMLNPEQETASVSQVIGALQQELARQKTQLKALRSYLSDTAPEALTARSRINALALQIEQERSKQVHTGGTGALNSLVVGYRELQVNVQVATDIYQTGLATLEAAKLDASRKVKHLVLVSAPTLPEDSTRPRRLYGTATAVALLHILYLIGGMLVVIIQDHRE